MNKETKKIIEKIRRKTRWKYPYIFEDLKKHAPYCVVSSKSIHRHIGFENGWSSAMFYIQDYLKKLKNSKRRRKSGGKGK